MSISKFGSQCVFIHFKQNTIKTQMIVLKLWIWRKSSNYEVTHVDEIHTKHYLCVVHDIHSGFQIQSSWFLSLCRLNCKLGLKDLNSDSSSYILPVCPQTNLQGGNRNLKNSAILQGDCFLVSIMPKTRLTCDG